MFSRLSVTWKFIFCFGGVIAACGVATLFVLASVVAIDTSNHTKQHAANAVEASQQAQGALVEQLNALRGYLLKPGSEFSDRFDKGAASYALLAKTIRAEDASPEAAALVDQLDSQVATFTQEAKDQIALASDPNTLGAARDKAMETARLLDARKTLKAIQDRETGVKTAADANQIKALTMAYGALLVGGACALVAALGFAWLLSRRVAAPISGMVGLLDRMAAGDTNISAPWTVYHDEVGAMARSLLSFRDAAQTKAMMEAEIAERSHAVETERKARDTAAQAVAATQSEVVRTLGDALQRLADGDLTVQITAPLSKEYVLLKDNFNRAIERLESAMVTVSGVAGSILSGAEEIAVAADDLSTRTEHQAATLEQTAAALDEITALVGNTSKSVALAHDAVEMASADAARSGQIVAGAIASMGEIARSSSEIGKIIGVIDEIAFQTNLLALNAGVEAARAGEAGRGFAVVATEVRALAGRSADAAREIKTLIAASGQEVDKGVDQVSRTGEALEGIIKRVAEIDGLIREVAGAAREQSTGLVEVNTAVSQMDHVVQQNAAMVEESTAATHNLRTETEELHRLVGHFQVRSTTARRTAA